MFLYYPWLEPGPRPRQPDFSANTECVSFCSPRETSCASSDARGRHLVIAAGVAALLFAGGFIEWILRELREQTIRTQLGHIRSGPPCPRKAPHPRRNGAPSPRFARVRPHRTLPACDCGRATAVAERAHQPRRHTLTFVGEGLDPALDTTARNVNDLVTGKPLDQRSRSGILVGEGLAASLGVKPGDKAVVLVNLPQGGVNASDVVVTGIFRTVSKSYDDAAIRIPLALAQSLLRSTGADVWVVSLDRTERRRDSRRAACRPALRNLAFVPGRRSPISTTRPSSSTPASFTSCRR